MGGKTGTRNAPTMLNAMFSRSLYWDGRAPSLEEQAKQPLINPNEMAMLTLDAVVRRVAAIPEYQESFRQVFRREGITIDTIVKALASYERVQISGNSPFDRFMAGDKNALTLAQQSGETNSFLDQRMHPLGLTDEEMNSLVEFMRALTSDDVLRQAQSIRPQTRAAKGAQF